MKIAYFDTIAGISGDMTLGAFVSAGVPFNVLTEEIKKLGLEGAELSMSKVQRSGITAVKIDVQINHVHEHHKGLSDIMKIIDSSSLSAHVKDNARKIFMEVAKAEAAIHNTSIEKIHFHEVGAIDSIVDIVGAAICFEVMGIEKTYSSPIKVGSGGLVQAQHGKLPIPSPATIEILKEYPVVLTDINDELTTPTGAAIIKAMSSGVLCSEQIQIEKIGYGSGTKEFPAVPNLLRVFIGDLIPAYEEDQVLIIETNIDNMNPEIYPYVIEQLLANGALDAYMVPVIMKKGRPGILLSVLVNESRKDDIFKIIFTQTTTIGVRFFSTNRKKIERETIEINTSFGMIKVKAINFDGKNRLVPEYEECKKIASEKKMPLIQVYKTIEKDISNSGNY